MGVDSKLPKPKSGVLSVDYTAGCGWCIRDEHGQRISGWYARRNDATTYALALQEHHDRLRKRCERPCLCCGVAFPSEGIHNRMCNDCRRRDSTTLSIPAGSTGKVRRAARLVG